MQKTSFLARPSRDHWLPILEHIIFLYHPLITWKQFFAKLLAFFKSTQIDSYGLH